MLAAGKLRRVDEHELIVPQRKLTAQPGALGRGRALYLADGSHLRHKYTKDMQVREMYSPPRRGVLTLYALPDTVEQGLTEAQAYNIVWDAFNEIQQKCPTAMVFYGQDTGYKLQKSHDELGVLLPLKEFEHNILHHLEQVDGIVLRCREEMIHQAGKDSLPL